ncbi:ATP-binding cassette domain-containing protein, partial [bacterium]|nr:ATP-binding cassette domain-containing protein [bacterium]
MNDPNSIIEVKDLTIGYGERVVMQNLNFSVKKGEIFVIAGGSGCGKSTLLKHLFGLYAPISGDILFKGESIADWTIKERSFRIGYVMQNPNQMIS